MIATSPYSTLFYLFLPFFFLLPLPGFLRTASSAEASGKPNLIYILLDDAGYGDIGCYGQKKFRTPHIDRIAAEGLKFTNHYSASTVCAPTRCSLMTGLHTGRAVVRGNREMQPEGQAPMPADIVTIPRLLAKAGYATGMFGKWGLGAPGSVSDPLEHFDAFFGYNCQRHAHNHLPAYIRKNDRRIELDGKTHTHPLIMAEALAFIRERRDGPFFVYLPIAMPHAAMQAPEEYVAPFREKFPEFENTVGRYGGTEVANPIAGFAGMMTLIDDGIGELLALLKELGIDEKTLVTIASDNGPHREGGHDPDFFESNGAFRGYKRDLTEGGIRTFLLARWPGKIAPGTETAHVSAQWDMLPTFCELAGAESPDDIDGISMVPTLLGKDGQKQHDYLYWEFYERGGRKAARWGDWKAVQEGVAKDPSGPIAIYDLSADPGEERDLSAARPELVRRAQEIFAEAHVPSPDWVFQDSRPGGGKKR